MTILRWIVAAGIFLGFLLLALQNADHVSIRFFQWQSGPIPLIVLLLGVFAVGVAMGLLAGAVRSARLKRQLNRLRRDHAKHFAGNALPPAEG